MGPSIIIDTNVFSYIFRREALGGPYLTYIEGRPALPSFVTVGELLLGVQLRGWGEWRKAEILKFISQHTILESNRAVSESYAYIMFELRQLGRPVSSNDAWIAATAIAYGKTLLSHNRRDFENITGLELVSFAP